jgi:hypothetical protein
MKPSRYQARLKGQVMQNVIGRGSVVLTALLFTNCASIAGRVPNSPSPSGRQAVLAPIDGLDVRVLESNPPQYMLSVRAGLPSGCAERNRYETERVAEAITVTVLNWMPTGNAPCTMMYGSYELTISLGSDFRPGTTYSVSVNDKRTSFVAQWGSRKIDRH